MSKIDVTKPMELEDGTPVIDRKWAYGGDLALASRYAWVSIERGHSAEFDLLTGENRYKGSELGDREKRTLRNVVETPAIDWTKPLELSDGTSVNARPSLRCAGYRVHLEGSDRSHTRTFNADGTARLSDNAYVNWAVSGRTIRNRKETPMFTLNTPVETRGGNPARILSTDSKAYPGRPIIAERKCASGEWTVQAYYPDGRALRYVKETAEDLVVQQPENSQFFNLYADGTLGKSAHKTFNDARDRSKVGKTRIGIVEIVKKGENVKSSKLTACVPYTRTSGYAASSWTAA